MSSSPIKSRFIAPRITASRDNCPVSDPSLGIISENDHRVGLCLCKFCECGEHTCPNPLIKGLYPHSTFTSKYQSDYQRGSFDVPLKSEPKVYMPNTLKMDFRTTHQEDFKPFSVSPKKRSPHEFPQTNQIGLPMRSAYSSEFVDWGPNNIQVEKRFQPLLRSQEIPFRGQSSYQNSFRDIDPRKIDLYKTNIADIGAVNSTIALGPREPQKMQTTYGEKMQDFSKSGLNKIIKVNGEVNGLFPSCAPHFQTTSQNFYQNKLPESKDPRKVRLALNKKARR